MNRFMNNQVRLLRSKVKIPAQFCSIVQKLFLFFKIPYFYGLKNHGNDHEYASPKVHPKSTPQFIILFHYKNKYLVRKLPFLNLENSCFKLFRFHIPHIWVPLQENPLNFFHSIPIANVQIQVTRRKICNSIWKKSFSRIDLGRLKYITKTKSYFPEFFLLRLNNQFIR